MKPNKPCLLYNRQSRRHAAVASSVSLSSASTSQPHRLVKQNEAHMANMVTLKLKVILPMIFNHQKGLDTRGCSQPTSAALRSPTRPLQDQILGQKILWASLGLNLCSENFKASCSVVSCTGSLPSSHPRASPTYTPSPRPPNPSFGRRLVALIRKIHDSLAYVAPQSRSFPGRTI